ncbi:L-2-hydroxyglutarate oxidase [Aestuariivivens sediminicola]|uniref:L-2-hydroxyglutarate oxidase n=1 Tax=Aestuariivivens sediminicola TaxID=2913560 RepID=UPI001F58E875|nr:L-2-hydroxyglutarate oxidase [Aestuariivivens sediminicola]
MKLENSFDIGIVGGGIIGLATAYKIQLKYPDLKLVLIEKESELAAHQTGHNSGVIHSGLYYKPGSAKARNCVSGRRQLVEFAKSYNVNHDVCGKVVVAVDEEELPHLDHIYENGKANGTEGIAKISGNQVRDIEPYVNSIGGIWVPCTGIIDFIGVTNKLAELLTTMQPKSKIILGEEVLTVHHNSETSIIVTSKNNYLVNKIIYCGGLQSDRLAIKDGFHLRERIVGFRGDYYNLSESAKNKVKNLIYPVPNPAFPFLGVHFTRMVDGDVECGPNAVLTFKREGYGKTDFNMKDAYDALSYSGTWKLLYNHTGFAINEYRRAFSKKRFLKTLQRLIPSLRLEDIEPGRSGVRAMLLRTDGAMEDDFKIIGNQRCIHVLNAPSPAATACLAIGDRIRDMASTYFNLG